MLQDLGISLHGGSSGGSGALDCALCRRGRLARRGTGSTGRADRRGSLGRFLNTNRSYARNSRSRRTAAVRHEGQPRTTESRAAPVGRPDAAGRHPHRLQRRAARRRARTAGDHRGELYRLRPTALDKLILTK
ncbi:MAG: hemin uptake protein HemP [Burkholderiales bacterium]|nr:hemin uptake protein HemP [Burkholderiales bacterium]